MTTYADMTKAEILSHYNELVREYTARARDELDVDLGTKERKQFQNKADAIKAIEDLKTWFQALKNGTAPAEEIEEIEEEADPVAAADDDLDLRPGWLKRRCDEARARVEGAGDVGEEGEPSPELAGAQPEADELEADGNHQEEEVADPEAPQTAQRARRSVRGSGPKPYTERGIFLAKLDGTLTLSEAAESVGRDRKWASVVVSCLRRDYGLQFEQDSEGRVRVLR